MSIGNQKSEGQKSLNYPWQWGMLDSLRKIYEKLGGSDTDNKAYIGRTSATAAFAANTLKAISISNDGSNDATVNGVVLKSGEAVAWAADEGKLLSTAFSINATGTDVLITAVEP